VKKNEAESKPHLDIMDNLEKTFILYESGIPVYFLPEFGYYWVRQGSMQGYVDETGKWFYRESVYQTLDD